MTAAVIATGLGKRYRHHWGLRDCTLQIPHGRVAALVGPNGAGKTTLLHLAAACAGPPPGRCASSGGHRTVRSSSWLTSGS